MEGEKTVKLGTGSGEGVLIRLGGQPQMQEARRGLDSTIDGLGLELTGMEQKIQAAVAQIKQEFDSLSQNNVDVIAQHWCGNSTKSLETLATCPFRATSATASIMRVKSQPQSCLPILNLAFLPSLV